MNHAPWFAAPIRRYALAALFAALTLLLVAVLTAPLTLVARPDTSSCQLIAIQRYPDSEQRVVRIAVIYACPN